MPPAQQRRRVWPWALGGIVVVLIGIVALAGSGSDKPRPAASPPSVVATPPAPSAPPPLFPTTAAGGRQIVYEVTSDGPLSTVTYFNEINDMTQLSDQPANWSTSFEGKATYQMHSMSAQTKGTQVSCRITVDGTVLAQETATGRYAVVTCAG